MKEDNNYDINNNNNQFTITNKSFIEKQKTPTEEEKERQDLKFLYQITGNNFKLSNLKQNIGIFLELTNDIFNDFKMMSDTGKKTRNIHNDSKQKINNESLYINKVKCFNNNLELFKKKLTFIEDKNKRFNSIFDFIKELKNYGFLLDDKFDINANDMVLDLNQFIIQHKWINNYEGLINIKNKNFKIIGDVGKYKLISDFYNYYNNKYILDYKIEIKIKNDRIHSICLGNEMFNDVIDKNIEKIINIPEIKEMLLFYIKYLLYKFFKEEINSLRKYQKNESKDEFQYSGLTFIINKYPNKLCLICSYFDNIEINFSIIKKEKEKEKYNFNNNNRMNLVNNIFSKFIKLFIENIFYEIRHKKNILNFIGEVKRNSNANLENIIKNSIFVKNVTNIELIFLKNELNNLITKYIIDKNIIYTHNLNIHEGPLGRYKMYIELLERGMKIMYIVELVFDNNLNLTLIIKEPFKNLIFSLDQGQTIYIEKGRINFNYLFEILRGLILNIGMNNEIKYIQRNNIL